MMSENYYGNPTYQKKDEATRDHNLVQSYDDSICKQVVVILTSILGVISLLALIALNIANLIEIYKTKSDSGKLSELSDKLSNDIGRLQTDITSDVKPKVDLINTMTSFKIPTLITTHSRLLQSDIVRYCTPRYDAIGKECPVTFEPVNSPLFNLFEPTNQHDCITSDQAFSVVQNITFFPFAPFIPTSSAPAGCVRIPSFSLSQTIYSYTHNQINRGCHDSDYSHQFWTIGKVVSTAYKTPAFESIINWFFGDAKNRKSCATASGSFGAWLGCTLVKERERDDFASPGTQDLSISYMDVYGRRKEWIFRQDDIHFDRPYNALYFSVGSGVIINGRVYFLAYGGLTNSVDWPAYCWSPGCSQFNQATCNQAQRPYVFSQKQTVNAIVSFPDNFKERPIVTVKTIPGYNYDMGSEGRLYYFPQSQKTFIYKRSVSWHALLFFGEIDLLGNLTIQWYDFTQFSRPGDNPCTASNRCPKVCVTGVYTDYFPLAPRGNLGVSVVLRNNERRIGPTIQISTLTQTLLRHYITTSSQEGAYSTTTCFWFDNKLWCLSIVEMAPGTIGIMQPISLLYPVRFTCVIQHNPYFGEGSGMSEEFIYPIITKPANFSDLDIQF